MTGDSPNIGIVHPQLRERLEKIEVEVTFCSITDLSLIYSSSSPVHFL
jgi:hypothetical protein